MKIIRNFNALGMRLLLCLVWLSLEKSITLLAESHQAGRIKGPPFELDRSRLKDDLEFLSAEPHPFGSPAQLKMAGYLEGRARSLGLRTVREAFSALSPDPRWLKSPAPKGAPLTRGLLGLNLWAFEPGPQRFKCLVIFASHYDTKDLSPLIYRGANDGASSSAGLLALIPQLKKLSGQSQQKCHWALVWFDGEESVLPEWTDGLSKHPSKMQDNTYGSRHAAEHYKGLAIEALILFDLIASPHLQLTWDQHSSADLWAKVQTLDALLYPQQSILSRNKNWIEDDHIPFIKKGVRAIDLIDFENLEHWHKPSDLPALIDYNSVVKVLRLGYELGKAMIAP